MKTFERICIKDWGVQATIPPFYKVELKWGEKYITSSVGEDGMVTVFTNYWVLVPADIFAGEKAFT